MLTNQTTTKIASILLGLSLLGLPAVGCSTTGGKRISGTTSSMADIEQLTEEGEQQVDALMISMDDLEDAVELDRAYRDLNSNIEEIQDTSEQIRERRTAMETKAAEHAALWRNESGRLSGEQAQEISDQRLVDFEQAVADVGEELDELRADYEPFIEKLRDLQVMLSNDLTRRGVELSQPVRARIAEMAQDLREQGADTRAALDRARSEFAQ